MRFLRTVVILILIAVAALFSFIYLPIFENYRQSYAAKILGAKFGRNVVIKGPVRIRLGTELHIEIDKIDVQALSSTETRRIEHGELSFPFLQMITGRVEISRLLLRGAEFEIEPRKANVTSSTPDPEGRDFLLFPSWFAKSRLSRNLNIRDLVFRYYNPDAGWDEKITFKKLTSKLSQDGTKIEIEAIGDFNGVDLSADAQFDNPSANPNENQISFNAGISFSGSTSRLSGTMDVSNPVAVVDVQLQSKSDSIGELLVALRLNRVLEGTGQAKAQFTGSMDAVRATNILASVEGPQSHRLAIEGTIENLSEGSGLELKISGNLPLPEKLQSASKTFLNLSVTGFEGNLRGRFRELNIDNFVLHTNAVSAELSNIGPITIDKIAKNKDGHLAILGIHIIDGPSERPVIDLTGELTDVLNMKGFSLAGRIDMETVDAFSLEGAASSQVLGRLQGEVAISDKDGTFGIEKLNAQIKDSELISMDLSLVADELRELDEISLMVDMRVPNFAKFAAALGLKSKAKGGLFYQGEIAIHNEIPVLRGKIEAGKTVVVGELKGALKDGARGLSGSLKSDKLQIGDIRSLWEISQFRKKQDVDFIKFNEDALDDMVLDVGIDIKQLIDKAGSAGNILGQLSYRNGQLNLDPFKVKFLGGGISAKVAVDTVATPNLVTATGSATKFNIGRLLSDLRLPPIATGSLSAKFDISGTGDNPASLLKNASGSFVASIWKGSIGTNLLDLTGMNIVSWMVTKSKNKSTELVCALFPFRFTKGVAKTNSLILETENVQAVGRGMINLRNNTIDLSFRTIGKNKSASSAPTPFSVKGSLASPKIATAPGAIQKRVMSDSMTMPLNMFPNLFGKKDKAVTKDRNRPCVIRPVKTKPKG